MHALYTLSSQQLHPFVMASESTWRSSSSHAMTRPVSYALLLPMLVGQSVVLSTYSWRTILTTYCKFCFSNTSVLPRFWQHSVKYMHALVHVMCGLEAKTCQRQGERRLKCERYASLLGTIHQNVRRHKPTSHHMILAQNDLAWTAERLSLLLYRNHIPDEKCDSNLRGQILVFDILEFWSWCSQLWKGKVLDPACTKQPKMLDSPIPLCQICMIDHACIQRKIRTCMHSVLQ